MKGGKRYGSARGLRDAHGERMGRAIADEEAVGTDAGQARRMAEDEARMEAALRAADDLDRVGEADAPPLDRAPAEGPAAQGAEGAAMAPPKAGARFIGGSAGAETGVIAGPRTGKDEVEALLGPPPPAVLEVAKAVAQGKKGADAYAGYKPFPPPEPKRPRRVLNSDEVEGRLMEPGTHLAFALPEGAVLHGEDDAEFLHLGGGVFATKRPVWVLEGWTVDGSGAAKAWPDGSGEGSPAGDDADKEWKGELIGVPPAWDEANDRTGRVATLRVLGEPDTTPEGEARLAAVREAHRARWRKGSAAFEAARKIALAHPAAADALPPLPEGSPAEFVAAAERGVVPPEFGAFVRGTVERRVRHTLEGFILDAPAELGPPPPLEEHVAVRVEAKDGLIHPDVVLEARTPYGAELIARYEALDMPRETDAA